MTDRGHSAIGSFLSELKRRRVFRVAAVYAVVAWLVIQIAETTFPYLALPAWAVTLVIALALLGFPIALVLAWAFDLTPEGVVRTEATALAGAESATDSRSGEAPVSARPGSRSPAARIMALTVVLLASGALGWFVLRGGEALPRGEVLLTALAELIEGERYVQAFELAQRASARGEVVPDSLWLHVMDHLTVISDPPGARVLAQRIEEENDPSRSDWQDLGRTPLRGLPVARGDYLLRLEMEGHATAERVEAAGWTRERILYDGPGRARVIAYLYLPKAGRAPYQTLVYVPSSVPFYGEPVTVEVEWLLGPLVRSGRALLVVVMEGMTEREWPAGYERPAARSVAFRDQMVRHATELRMGLDYLETRDEIAMRSLAYVGLSWGAGSRLLFAALDERFGAVAFIGGGIDERVHPTLAEASNVNFAPRVRVPKLLLNGEQDEEHPWLTRALPLWNLLTEPKELVLVEGAGHVPPLEARVPALREWLDRTFGPVGG